MASPRPPPLPPPPPPLPVFDMKLKQLNDYCLLEVFKYLPLEERMRNQRVDKRWGSVLERLFFQQKSLVICGCKESLERETLFACGNAGHAFGEREVVFLQGMPAERENEAVRQLLAKCPHLKALYWFHDLLKIEPEWLSGCSRLEHVHYPFGLKPLHHFVKSVADVKLKCLEMPINEWQDHQLNYDTFREIIEGCSLLEVLSVKPDLAHFSVQPVDVKLLVESLAPVLPKLKKFEFKRYSNDWKLKPFLLQELARLGQGLDTLSYVDFSQESNDFNKDKETVILPQVLKRLPNLKSILFMGFCQSIQHFLALDRIERISLLPEGTAYKLIGPKANLKTLRIREIENADEALLVPTYYPNLEELELDFDDYDNFSVLRMPYRYFVPLKRLRWLSLSRAKITDGVINNLLHSCPDLREVRLIDCDSLSPHILQFFSAFARLHPKRVVKVYIKDCHFERIEDEEDNVAANLRLFFD